MQTLSSVGRDLIDIHGQHEHQGLLKKENHMFYIDTYGNLDGSVAAVQLLYNELAVLRDTITAMRERMLERAQRIEFLRFQIAEIDSASLIEGEKPVIEEERSILLHLNKLKEASET